MMNNSHLLRRSIQAIALLASVSVFGLVADEANAQRLGGSSCQTGLCVTPPPQDVCCTPRLGFTGEVNCHGMFVLDVVPYSQACRMGLQPGDTILRVNGRRITSHRQFQRLLQDALIYRHGHVDLVVKQAGPYQQIVTLHADLVHTCRRGGIGH